MAAIADKEERIIDALGDESEALPFRYSISSYGADYTVDGLVRRIDDGSIYVPTFQRGYVWNIAQASRFIESFLLGLPVPGIFLSREQETQKLLVIDGQQRLRTLQFFYQGVFPPTGRGFALSSVQPELKGATYRSLPPEDKRRLDDSILHATIVKQDDPPADESSVYLIFERINTGSVQLSAQEIRASIYHGEFSDLLKRLNATPSWRNIYGVPSKRMRDQELILRFLALHFHQEQYQRPMKEFLNNFMWLNKHLRRFSEERISRAFVDTMDVAHSALGAKAFKPARALNAAIFDAVMVGICRRLEEGPIVDLTEVRSCYEKLLTDESFLPSTERATADEVAVQTRISAAQSAFQTVS